MDADLDEMLGLTAEDYEDVDMGSEVVDLHTGPAWVVKDPPTKSHDFGQELSITENATVELHNVKAESRPLPLLDELSTSLQYYEARYSATCTDGIYRIPLAALEDNAACVVRALEDHGFFVLVETGDGEGCYSRMRAELELFFIENNNTAKEACTSDQVYCSEKGIRMWQCGEREIV
jgi:hypothetical protein